MGKRPSEYCGEIWIKLPFFRASKGVKSEISESGKTKPKQKEGGDPSPKGGPKGQKGRRTKKPNYAQSK